MFCLHPSLSGLDDFKCCTETCYGGTGRLLSVQPRHFLRLPVGVTASIPQSLDVQDDIWLANVIKHDYEMRNVERSMHRDSESIQRQLHQLWCDRIAVILKALLSKMKSDTDGANKIESESKDTHCSELKKDINSWRLLDNPFVQLETQQPSLKALMYKTISDIDIVIKHEIELRNDEGSMHRDWESILR